jgi:hypothetical protein
MASTHNILVCKARKEREVEAKAEEGKYQKSFYLKERK